MVYILLILKCSKTCGAGIHQREVYCVFNLRRVVDRSHCSDSTMPSTHEPCNDHECPAWQTPATDAWSECSCEKGAKRHREIPCVYQNSRVDPLLCLDLSSLVSSKPLEIEDCPRDHCPIWHTTSWSECSTQCGPGVRSRDVFCAPASEAARRVDHVYDPNVCDQTERPENTTECSEQPECPEWRISSWSACSVTCGQGVRMRRVFCSTGVQANCAIESKPKNSESCGMSACVAEWHAGNWSEVSRNFVIVI